MAVQRINPVGAVSGKNRVRQSVRAHCLRSTATSRIALSGSRRRQTLRKYLRRKNSGYSDCFSQGPEHKAGEVRKTGNPPSGKKHIFPGLFRLRHRLKRPTFRFLNSRISTSKFKRGIIWRKRKDPRTGAFSYATARGFELNAATRATRAFYALRSTSLSLRSTRCFSSILMTLTRTMSPTLTTSVTLSTRSLLSLEMCIIPSLPGAKLTLAPN